MPHTTADASASPAEVAAARAFVELLFPSPRGFTVRLWEGTVLPAEGKPAFTLVVRDRGSLRRMFQTPVELSLGEA